MWPLCLASLKGFKLTSNNTDFHLGKFILIAGWRIE